MKTLNPSDQKKLEIQLQTDPNIWKIDISWVLIGIFIGFVVGFLCGVVLDIDYCCEDLSRIMQQDEWSLKR
jgi:hypothetical protein